MMKNLIIFLFIFFTASLFGQTYSIKKSRQWFSEETRAILDSLGPRDTLYKGNGGIESQYLGEASVVSKEYLLYSELIKVATEKELLSILDNPNELPYIRAYALMGYVYKCEKEKKPEKHFNYKFRTNVSVGCVTYSNCSFAEINHKIHVRHFYDPTPRYFVIDSLEQNVIKKENEIRKEQGVPLRKE